MMSFIGFSRRRYHGANLLIMRGFDFGGGVLDSSIRVYWHLPQLQHRRSIGKLKDNAQYF
jgi:hypothetical protein